MDMRWRRWYPTVTLLPSGKVFIMGGTQVCGRHALVREARTCVGGMHMRHAGVWEAHPWWDERRRVGGTQMWRCRCAEACRADA
eukprot:362917-Chlamydomonas_euryale.AAC.9